MCTAGPRIPQPTRVEPLKQVAPDDAAARDNTMRRLMRRYSLNRTNITGGNLGGGAPTGIAPIGAPGRIPSGGKSLLGQ